MERHSASKHKQNCEPSGAVMERIIPLSSTEFSFELVILCFGATSLTFLLMDLCGWFSDSLFLMLYGWAQAVCLAAYLANCFSPWIIDLLPPSYVFLTGCLTPLSRWVSVCHFVCSRNRTNKLCEHSLKSLFSHSWRLLKFIMHCKIFQLMMSDCWLICYCQADVLVILCFQFELQSE